MKRNSLFESRRKRIPNEVRESVSLSFDIVDRIHEILVAKGLKQKDLAEKLGKSEAEISKWMRGTHNFTIETISSIQDALGEKIIDIHREGVVKSMVCVLLNKKMQYDEHDTFVRASQVDISLQMN